MTALATIANGSYFSWKPSNIPNVIDLMVLRHPSTFTWKEVQARKAQTAQEALSKRQAKSIKLVTKTLVICSGSENHGRHVKRGKNQKRQTDAPVRRLSEHKFRTFVPTGYHAAGNGARGTVGPDHLDAVDAGLPALSLPDPATRREV